MFKKNIRQVKNNIYPIIKTVMLCLGKILTCNYYRKNMPDMKKIKKILFVHTAYLGDTLFTTPVISEMKKKYPYIEIFYLTYKKNFTMLENNNDIIELLDYNNISKDVINEYNFDISIDFKSSWNTTLLLLKTNIKYRIGTNNVGLGFLFSHMISKKGKHIIEQYFSYLKPFKLFYKNNKTSFTSSEDEILMAKLWLKENQVSDKFIAVHISAGWEAKRWPSSNFNKLFEELSDIHFILLGGPNDSDIVKQMNLSKSNVYNAVGKSIRFSAAIINLSSLFLGHDSSFLHIATAMNKKTISLFGPTNPEIYGPVNDNKNTIIQSNEKCIPHGKNPYCNTYAGREGCDDYICMKNILSSEVIEIIKRGDK